MGTISFQVTSGNPAVGTRTKTYNVPDADIDRLVTAMMPYAAPQTPAGALLYWSSQVMARTKDMVRDREQATALSSVTEIAAT